MRKLRYVLEYLFVLLMDALLSLPPRRFALKLGDVIGLAFSRLLPNRRRLIYDNLSRSFPDMPRQEKERVAESVWKNLGRTAIEFVRMPEIRPDNQERFISYEGLENIRESERLGRGTILATAHFSNWEMTGVGVQLAMEDLIAIARPMKNPYVEAWVQRKRSKGGMEIILHRQAVKESLRALRRQKKVGILMDQNLYTGGVFVDFFGRPAATTPLPALLHARTGAPVILTYSLRDGDRFKVIFEKPMKFPVIEDQDEMLKVHTQIVTKALEDVVRKNPSQWFWIHNRWKRQPEPA